MNGSSLGRWAGPILISLLCALAGCQSHAVRPTPASKPAAPRLFTVEDLPHLVLRGEDLPEGGVFGGLRESAPWSKTPSASFTWAKPTTPTEPPSWVLDCTLTLADSPESAAALVEKHSNSWSPKPVPAPVGSELSTLGDRVWLVTRAPAYVAVEFTQTNLLCEVSVRSATGRQSELVRDFSKALNRRIAALLAGHPGPIAMLPAQAGSPGPTEASKQALKILPRPWGARTVTVGVRMEKGIPRTLPALPVGDDYLVPLAELLSVLRVPARYGSAGPDQPTVDFGAHKLFLHKGSRQAQVDGTLIHLGQPADLVEGKTMAPLSLVKTVFGLEMVWGREAETPLARLHIPDSAAAPIPLLPDPTENDLKSEHPLVEVAKRAYHSDTWPGKDGKLRPGVNVRAATAGMKIAWNPFALGGERRSEDTPSVYWGGHPKEGSPVDVNLWVRSTPAEAQEALIEELCRTERDQRVFIQPIGVYGETRLGDVAFLGPLNVPNAILFVRDNVTVRVARHAQGDSPLAVARVLDRALLARPKVESLEAFGPKIESMRFNNLPTPPRLEMKMRGEVGVRVNATDPGHGALSYLWRATSPLTARARTRSDGSGALCGPGVFAAMPDPPPVMGAWQTSQVSVVVANELGLTAQKTIPVEVRVTGY